MACLRLSVKSFAMTEQLRKVYRLYRALQVRCHIQLMLRESCWFQNIIANIQAKYQASSTTFNDKISLLTLLPEDWKFSQVKEYFQCTYYMFCEIKKLRENIGKYRLTCYLYIYN